MSTPQTLARQVPFRRLVWVETRKLFDTRSGLVMTGILVAAAVALVVGRAATVGPPRLFTLAGTAAVALGVLLPVLGIITVTGEWSHRTALTTFALEPRRARVLAAKCLPALAAAVLGSLLAVLVAVPATALSASVLHVEPTWEVAPRALAGWIVVMVLQTAQGLALGLLLLNAPAAIVVCLAGPMLWSFVAAAGDGGQAVAEWLDLNRTTGVLMSGELTGDGVARLVTSVLVWVVIPMATGVARVVRSDLH
ncbi:hypothetical protein [Nonomuraea sp. NPDC050643]|uniref:hypothetical protein n=1 Tax=Nonomuraea sp. NPDC050643 TaxID=3155660 RepID=UPI0033E07C56